MSPQINWYSRLIAVSAKPHAGPHAQSYMPWLKVRAWLRPSWGFSEEALPRRSGSRFCARRMLVAPGTPRWKAFVGQNARRIELAVGTPNPDFVYAWADGDAGNSSRLNRTADGGVRWNRVQIGEPTSRSGYQSHYNQTLTVHPLDVDRLLLRGIWLVKASLLPKTWKRSI